MHRILVPVTGILVLAALGFTYAASDNRQAEEGLVTVTIDVTCPGDRVELSVDPWTAYLFEGDSIDWVLTEGSDAAEFEIVRKTRGQGNWPFADSPPYRGGKPGSPNRAQGRRMKPDQGGRSYSYSIEMSCSSEGSGPFNVVIDPDMIVKKRQ